MLTLAGVSACGRPLVTSGMALVMPPVPVLVADAGAVAPEPGLDREGGGAEAGAGPKVTWSLVPSKSSAEPVGTVGVAEASFEARRLVVGRIDGGDGVEVLRCRRRRWCRCTPAWHERGAIERRAGRADRATWSSDRRCSRRGRARVLAVQASDTVFAPGVAARPAGAAGATTSAAVVKVQVEPVVVLVAVARPRRTTRIRCCRRGPATRSCWPCRPRPCR